MNRTAFRRPSLFLPLLFALFVVPLQDQTNRQKRPGKLRFGVSFSQQQCNRPLDGRVLLMISTTNTKEPRFQVTEDPNTQLIFGIDVDGSHLEGDE